MTKITLPMATMACPTCKRRPSYVIGLHRRTGVCPNGHRFAVARGVR